MSGFGDLVGLPLALPDLLGSTAYSKWSVVILTLWKNTGFTMVVYLAALQGVPPELYDAAHADGASGWQRFQARHPAADQPDHVLPVRFRTNRRVPAFHGTLRHQARRSGPVVHARRTYIYENAFRYTRMGKASAIAWFLFIFIFGFTLIQNIMQRRWVHYETE